MTQKERLIEFLSTVECEGADRREGGCNFRQDGRCNRINKLEIRAEIEGIDLKAPEDF